MPVPTPSLSGRKESIFFFLTNKKPFNLLPTIFYSWTSFTCGYPLSWLILSSHYTLTSTILSGGSAVILKRNKMGNDDQTTTAMQQSLSLMNMMLHNIASNPITDSI